MAAKCESRATRRRGPSLEACFGDVQKNNRSFTRFIRTVTSIFERVLFFYVISFSILSLIQGSTQDHLIGTNARFHIHLTDLSNVSTKRGYISISLALSDINLVHGPARPLFQRTLTNPPFCQSQLCSPFHFPFLCMLTCCSIHSNFFFHVTLGTFELAPSSSSSHHLFLTNIYLFSLYLFALIILPLNRR